MAGGQDPVRLFPILIRLAMISGVGIMAGCAQSFFHSPDGLDAVVVPVEISVSPPTSYPGMPPIRPSLWQPPELNFQTLTLDNGIQVLLHTVSKGETTSIYMELPYDASLQPAAEELLAQHWFIGDTEMRETEIRKQWQCLGDQQYLGTWDNRVIFSNFIKTEDLNYQLRLMARLMAKRDLQIASLERQWRFQRVLDLAGKEIPTGLAMPFYQHITWREDDRPSTFPVDSEQLKSQYSKLVEDSFCLPGFRLYIESNIRVEQLRPMLESTIAQLKGDDNKCGTAGLKPQAVAENTIYLLDKDGSQQVDILLGVPTVQRSHKDWQALTTLSEILGEENIGRLFQDLRERQGLTYGAFASHREREGGSDFIIRMQAKPNKVAASLHGILAHIQSLADVPVFEAEIQDASASRQGSLMQTLDIASGRLELKAYTDRFGLTFDELLQSSIDRLSPVELQQVARQYLASAWQIILVGDEDVISDQLADYFPGYLVVTIPAEKAINNKP